MNYDYKPGDEPSDFAMSFCDQSDKDREPMTTIWDEVEDNWLVRPYRDDLSSSTKYPAYGPTDSYKQRQHWSQLKDPETHQEVMTIISGIVLALYPQKSQGFTRVRRVGAEDLYRSMFVQGLVEYASRLPHAFMTNVHWILSSGIYGTGMMELFWDYITEPRVFRNIEVDPEFLEEFQSDSIIETAVYDDVRREQFSVRDFYPDHSRYFIDQMAGAARKSRVNADVAMSRAESGIYNKAKVQAAIDARAGMKVASSRKTTDISDLDPEIEAHAGLRSLDMIRYVGYCPIKHKDGFYKREIVILGGETVRDAPWPRRLPWFDVQITPRLGSFWGISPAELIRRDQDFLDTLKMMLADAVVRVTHPPPIYDMDGSVELHKLRQWHPDVPIGVRGNPNDKVSTVSYNPNLQAPSNMIGMVKQQSREATSATDSRQGLPFGTKRMSATEAGSMVEAGSTRPELFVRVIEQEYSPQVAKYEIELYREHATTEDLLARVGQQFVYPGASLADLQLDYDVEFIGSRIEGTPEEELTMLREMLAAGANPIAQQLLPWIPMFKRFFENRGAYDLAAMVGDPQMVQVHLMLNKLAAPGPAAGNGNGTTPALPNSALMPAQVQGHAL